MFISYFLFIPILTKDRDVSWMSRRDIAILKVTYQLSYVFLDGVWINKYGDRNQGVEGKIKDLVAEEWDDPACALLVCAVRSHGTDKDHENRNRDGNAHVCQKFFKKERKSVVAPLF